MEVLKGLKTDEGLAISLVACEPQVHSPVAMAFDEDERLFVVEMLDYPNPGKGAAPAGRIRQLEDKDGDGHYESAGIFADGLLMANGVMCWKGGLIVTAAPQILYLKDTDGDGRADQRDVLFEGFATGNPQLRVSHPTLGIDNCIYVANGARGGKVGKPGAKETIDIGGQDFRFNPLDGSYEAVSGFGQFGLTFDDWGRRFVCTNRNHLIEIVMERRYFARNKFLAAPPPVHDDQRPGGAARIFPISGNKTLDTRHAGAFTASCGVFVYRGGRMPSEYMGSVFTCEPTGNLVHRETLAQYGAILKGTPAKEGVEFLASSEKWFRPVSLTSGPDGAFYVIDICRADVEHPEWVPASLHHRYDFYGRRDFGRIWKIEAANGAQKAPRRRLSQAAVPELIELLSSDIAWLRTTAQRLILERSSTESIEPLRNICIKGADARAQAIALWLLKSLGKLDADIVAIALKSEHPRIRENAAQIAEPHVSTSVEIQQRLASLAGDADPRVRFQAALSLGYWDSDAILAPLQRIAERDADDRWTRMAVASAVQARAGKLLALLLERSPNAAILKDLSALVGARQNPQEVSETLAALAKSGVANQVAALSGMVESLSRRGSSLRQLRKNLDAALNEPVERMLKSAAAVASNADAPLAERIQAVLIVTELPSEQALEILKPLMKNTQPEAICVAAIQSAAMLPQLDAAQAILAEWKSSLPATRQQILSVMTGKAQRAAILLDAIEKGTITPGELGATAIRQLTQHGDKAISARAKKALKHEAADDRAAVIARYRPSLQKAGDATRGREVFAKNCSVCHKIDGVGHSVGPDITDTFRREPEALLTDILDPNRAIDTNYVSYIVKLKSGRVATGLVANQTGTSMTLRRDGGQDETLLLQDVAKVLSTGQSLMPVGLEQSITPEAMADLIAYLRNWQDLRNK